MALLIFHKSQVVLNYYLPDYMTQWQLNVSKPFLEEGEFTDHPTDCEQSKVKIWYSILMDL